MILKVPKIQILSTNPLEVIFLLNSIAFWQQDLMPKMN